MITCQTKEWMLHTLYGFPSLCILLFFRLYSSHNTQWCVHMRIAYIPRVVDIQRSITDVTHVVDVPFFLLCMVFFSKPFRLYLDGNEGEPAPLLFPFMSCMYVSVPRYEKKIWRHIDIDLMLNIPTLCFVLNYRFASFSFHVVFLFLSHPSFRLLLW